MTETTQFALRCDGVPTVGLFAINYHTCAEP
jgi:hypothetical protein